MSDIYLSLTETPSVVTLSQPVISGALSSTVTVANTVTVALDANSLSALENVTVTVGAAISGTVTVANFPASQTVQGTVTVGSLPAISGSVTINNFPSTQTVAGTVTASNLPVINYDESVESGQVVPVKISGYGQPAIPISGTVTASILNSQSELGTAAPAQAVQIGGYNLADNNLYPIHVDDQGVQTIKGTVTASLSNTVTATWKGAGGSSNAVPVVFAQEGQAGGSIVSYDGSNTSLNVNVKGSLPAISGTVTANAQGTITAGMLLVENANNSFPNQNAPVQLKANPLNGSLRVRMDYSPSADPSENGSSVVGNTNATEIGTISYIKARVVAGSVTIGSLPAISGTVTAANIQGAGVNLLNFNSTTASTTIVSANSSRKFLTIFNEGAGTLHISAGATATTASYQVRLLAGAYWECPNAQASLTHSGQFASAGTARVTEII